MAKKKKLKPRRIWILRCDDCEKPIDGFGYVAKYKDTDYYNSFPPFRNFAGRQEVITLCRKCAELRSGPWWNNAGGTLSVKTEVSYYFSRGNVPPKMWDALLKAVGKIQEMPSQRKPKKKTWKRVKGRQQSLSTRM